MCVLTDKTSCDDFIPNCVCSPDEGLKSLVMWFKSDLGKKRQVSLLWPSTSCFCKVWHMGKICYMSPIRRSNSHGAPRFIFLSRQLAKCLVNEVNTSTSGETVLNGRRVPGVRFLTKRFRSQHASETRVFQPQTTRDTRRKKGSAFKLTLSNFNNRLCFIFFSICLCHRKNIFLLDTLL